MPLSLEAAERNGDGRPFGAAAFARLMENLGPFEPAPRLAVGVSGGADSLALALLLQAWARERGGAVTALTVDHGLRRGSGAEARRVAAIMESRGVVHRVLTWRGPKPQANRQAAAREARFGLMTAWCGRKGVLHLALAHHLEDQAETLMLRLARGSGLDGLAAMAPVVETSELRLLRPLLSVPKARLVAFLRALGQPWTEDPSNRDEGFARVRMRALMPVLAREGASAPRLAAAAGHLGRSRQAVEQGVAALLARSVGLHPAGHAWLEVGPLIAAPEEISLRALSRLLMTVGGSAYPPRLERLRRLFGRLKEGPERAATLGGCRILPRHGKLLVVREPAAVPEIEIACGEQRHWDGRFRIAVARPSGVRPASFRLGPLGAAGWAEIKARGAAVEAAGWPAAARAVCPALRDGRGLAAVPSLGFWRSAAIRRRVRFCRFAPLTTLAPAGFTVA
ncbi:MAG: tRNA lysidine(34) synthetase TilS [Kiloniellales bacterium]|nr:tRNA lysidine(34) synthetase TilS [Kiloniellales bacterium]